MIEIRLDELLGADNEVDPISEGVESDATFRKRLLGVPVPVDLWRKIEIATGAELDALGRDLGLRRYGLQGF